MDYKDVNQANFLFSFSEYYRFSDSMNFKNLFALFQQKLPRQSELK